MYVCIAATAWCLAIAFDEEKLSLPMPQYPLIINTVDRGRNGSRPKDEGTLIAYLVHLVHLEATRRGKGSGNIIAHY